MKYHKICDVDYLKCVINFNFLFIFTTKIYIVFSDKIRTIWKIRLLYTHSLYAYVLSVYSPFYDRVGLLLHNTISPFLPDMDIFSVDYNFCHVRFYTL